MSSKTTATSRQSQNSRMPAGQTSTVLATVKSLITAETGAENNPSPRGAGEAAVAALMRGARAGKQWASNMAQVVEIRHVEGLRFAIEQWEFGQTHVENLPIRLPSFGHSRHSNAYTVTAFQAAIDLAKGHINAEYVRGFAVGALTEWGAAT